MNIISFDTFFFHEKFLLDFFPGWKLSYAKLKPIGVWRGDIVKKLKHDKKLLKIKNSIFRFK